MRGLRGVVLALLAIVLSACGYAGAAGGGPGNAAWQRGYTAGHQERWHYHWMTPSQRPNLMAFCARRAYVDVQPVKRSLVLWSEGFDAGCATRVRPGHLRARPAQARPAQARQRPSGTPAPR